MSETEAARIDALRRFRVWESPDAVYADTIRLAAQICGVRYAFLSVLEEDAERFVTVVGGELPEAVVRRDGSFGEALFQVYSRATSVATSSPRTHLLIPDTSSDERFADHAFVRQQPALRFYASVPLVLPDGKMLGTLAVADTSAIPLNVYQLESLETLARQVVAALEWRYRVEELKVVAALRARAEEEARRLANQDNLTGLPNRACFMERVEETIADFRNQGGSDTGGPVVLFVDLDRFKRINDTLGHASGDVLLREVAARFAGCLRSEDTLARFAGDEFTVLLPRAPGGLSYAANVSQMLLRTLGRPIVLGTEEIQIGASIGIALYPGDGVDAQTLLKHADIAMYQAKVRGGYEAYAQQMNADGYQRLVAEAELRHALERQELDLAFQPQLDLKTGRVVVVEALARWNHPQRGAVPPSHFIQVAEQADLIVPLGEWVLRRACHEVALRRADTNADMRVSVNLSARQLAQPQLVDTVRTALAENGLPGSVLELELTETALCANGDATPQTLQALRDMGVRISVDDFGTGYSSLAYLRRFPVDVLKIDRAFVAGLGTEPRDSALVQAIVNMAHALELRVVAEGVETELQCDCLRRLGCDSAQGFLFSRPLTGDGLRSLLLAQRPLSPVKRAFGRLTGVPTASESLRAPLLRRS